MELSLEIKSADGDYAIHLIGKSMDELVEKLFEWQIWENQSHSPLEVKGMRDSGWYIMKHKLNTITKG